MLNEDSKRFYWYQEIKYLIIEDEAHLNILNLYLSHLEP